MPSRRSWLIALIVVLGAYGLVTGIAWMTEHTPTLLEVLFVVAVLVFVVWALAAAVEVIRER